MQDVKQSIGKEEIEALQESVADAQTYKKYSGFAATSDVTLNNDAVYITGKNVSVYLTITTKVEFKGSTVITGLPKPVAAYSIAFFMDNSNTLLGVGWIYPDGSVRSPASLRAGTSYIVAHYTTY